jgi:hypothetical protein
MTLSPPPQTLHHHRHMLRFSSVHASLLLPLLRLHPALWPCCSLQPRTSTSGRCGPERRHRGGKAGASSPAVQHSASPNNYRRVSTIGPCPTAKWRASAKLQVGTAATALVRWSVAGIETRIWRVGGEGNCVSHGR